MLVSVVVCAFILVAVSLRLSSRWPVRRRALVAAAVLVLSLLPFPYGLAPWVLSYLGDFSLTSGMLALLAILHRLRGHQFLSMGQTRMACLLLVFLALWFYPMSLGSSYEDPYAWGFGDLIFSCMLLLLGVVAWLSRAYASCIILVVAQLAYAWRLLPSDNLWDYLIDPWLVFWASGWLIRDRLLARRARQRLAVSQPEAASAAPVRAES